MTLWVKVQGSNSENQNSRKGDADWFQAPPVHLSGDLQALRDRARISQPHALSVSVVSQVKERPTGLESQAVHR